MPLVEWVGWKESQNYLRKVPESRLQRWWSRRPTPQGRTIVPALRKVKKAIQSKAAADLYELYIYKFFISVSFRI